MNREEIKKILPHREPMLLLDESERDGDRVVSKYTIRENEFFTTGHFPGYPVVPGVILCEIMAQASFLLIPSEKLKDNTALYAGIDGAKFKASVFPGDTVCVESKEVTQRVPRRRRRPGDRQRKALLQGKADIHAGPQRKTEQAIIWQTIYSKARKA